LFLCLLDFSAGADPLLNMPSVEVLREKLLKTTAPIKAVLLDQNKASLTAVHGR